MKSNLVVVAGHGGNDPGTIAGALVERELNIEAVLSLNDYIVRTYRVPRPPNLIITRKGESSLDAEALLADRITTINRLYGSDVVIVDVHHNAETAGAGALIYYSQNAAATPGDESMILEPLIAEELAKVVGEDVPAIVSSRSRFGGLGITDNTLGSALLVECRKASASATFADRYAEGAAIARGLARYFKWAPILPPAPPPEPAPPVPTTPVTTTVTGSSRATLAQLVRYMWSGNPHASIAVPSLYMALAPIAGVRAEVAFAQAMKETAFLTFPRIARPEWHNFAGLGCDEASRVCNMWSTDEEGVRAHLGHLLVYFGEHAAPFCDLDQRHVAHRGLPNLVTELGGVGRWAPSPDYGYDVARRVDALLAL